MAKYTYEDIFKCELPHKQSVELYKELVTHKGMIYQLQDGMVTWQGALYLIHSLNKSTLVDYKKRNSYINAKSNEERALIAIKAKQVKDPAFFEHATKMLKLWLPIADTLTRVEKALMGWKKIL